MTDLLQPEPTCPCCGRPINELADLRWNGEARTLAGKGKALVLPRLRSRIFDVLWNRFSTGQLTHKSKMMDAMYGDDPNGGPGSDNIISVQVMHLKNQIKPFGLTVKGRGGYMLVVAEAEGRSS